MSMSSCHYVHGKTVNSLQITQLPSKTQLKIKKQIILTYPVPRDVGHRHILKSDVGENKVKGPVHDSNTKIQQRML